MAILSAIVWASLALNGAAARWGVGEAVFGAFSAQTTAGFTAADMIEGRDPRELSTLIRGDARIFAFVVGEADAGKVQEMDLPEQTRIICLYRDDRFILAEPGTELEAGDEVVTITHASELDELHERWSSTGRSARRCPGI